MVYGYRRHRSSEKGVINDSILASPRDKNKSFIEDYENKFGMDFIKQERLWQLIISMPSRLLNELSGLFLPKEYLYIGGFNCVLAISHCKIEIKTLF